MIPQFIFFVNSSPSSSPISVIWGDDDEYGDEDIAKQEERAVPLTQEYPVTTLSPCCFVAATSSEHFEYGCHPSRLPLLERATPEEEWLRTLQDWTPTTTPSLKPAPLQQKHSSSARTRRFGKRTVRGLWQEDESIAQTMSDCLLCRVFEYLNLADLVSCETVSPRWKAVSERNCLWEMIDATEFISQNSIRQVNKIATTRQLTQRLRPVTTSLTIRNVGVALSADHLHIPFWNLRHLYLSGFEELTDTHLQSLLLLATFRTMKLPLESIYLIDCPKLSSHRCQHLIRSLCINVQIIHISKHGDDDSCFWP